MLTRALTFFRIRKGSGVHDLEEGRGSRISRRRGGNDHLACLQLASLNLRRRQFPLLVWESVFLAEETGDIGA